MHGRYCSVLPCKKVPADRAGTGIGAEGLSIPLIGSDLDGDGSGPRECTHGGVRNGPGRHLFLRLTGFASMRSTHSRCSLTSPLVTLP